MKNICIEGNIGAGKTTMAKLLAKELGADLILEEFEENYLLPLFYKEPGTYAFAVEYSFLLDRFRQLKKLEAETAHSLTVSDYYIEKCLYFAKVNLQEEEYALFEKTYYNLLKTLRQPDLLIYFHFDPKLLKENIKKRNRNFESAIEEHYLEKVNMQYNYFSAKERAFQVINFHLKTNSPENYTRVFHEILSVLKHGSSAKWMNIEV